MSNILEARGICKTYEISGGDSQPILKDVSLQVREGEFLSVMGPSGSGKSTLLYCVSGMDKTTSGSVCFDGQEISTLTENALADLRLHKMGFIFQQSHMLKNLDILDNIVLPAYKAKKADRSGVVEKTKKLAAKTGIAGVLDHDITAVSGGQLQRAGICRALINDPKIIFGDEPTGALNSAATGEVMDILADINASGTTVMLVTHDAKVAAKSERVLFMIDGKVVAELTMGKYDRAESDAKEREEKLSAWLSELGF